MISMAFHLPDNLNSSVEKEISIPDSEYTKFMGCCKGIVCLMVSPGFESFILLNPFNGTFQNVSNPPPLYLRSSVGFGYDYATDDYKIVVLEHRLCYPRYFHVYSMRSNSWGQVVRECSPGSPPPEQDGICVEGSIHWFWKTHMNVDSCIFAFDLETESVRYLRLPPEAQIDTTKPRSLKDFGGRLCVLVQHHGVGTVIWVMEEYGIEATWTPLFTIAAWTHVLGYFPIWDNARLFCFELFCFESEWRPWVWLNTQDGSSEIIQIHPQHEEYNVFRWDAVKSWVCVRSPLRLPCSVLQDDSN